MRKYWSQLLRVSQALALGLARSLNLPDDQFFVEKMQDPVAQMLCVRYVCLSTQSSLNTLVVAHDKKQAHLSTADDADGTFEIRVLCVQVQPTSKK